MSEYAFYSFKDEALLAWGLEPTPMPVRRELEEAVFGGEQVRVDLLLDELDRFLEEYPDLRGLYAVTMEALAYLAGVNLGKRGEAKAAARYLQMGLEVRPESLLLRSNYALALQLQGKEGEALDQLKVVLADPEGKEDPMVRLLAARLLAEQGEYLEAYRLLNEVAPRMPADDAFWGLLAEMKELAGVQTAGPQQALCSACGNPLKEGWAFCGTCGAPVGAARPVRAFCRACGSPLKEGWVFCGTCGKPV